MENSKTNFELNLSESIKEGGLRTKENFKESFENKPLISIITVVYNGEEFLEETIKSIINQSYDNIEYIIIDGDSTDNTINIIKNYEDKIDYWTSEKDKGIYDAMNKGIDLASGKWLNFMNAGDKLFPTTTVEDIFTKNNLNNINIIMGKTKLSSGKEISVGKINKFILSYKTPFCHQSTFYQLDTLKENKFNLYYKILADIEQFIRIYNYNMNYLVLDLTISYYDTPITSKKYFLKAFKEKLIINFKLNKIFLPIYLLYSIKGFLGYFLKGKLK